MLTISKKGFDGYEFADGQATETSNVIRLDSPWAIQFFSFVIPSELGNQMGVQLQISPDNDTWVNHGGEVKSGTATATVYTTSTWGIPQGAKYARFLAGGSTDDTVTVDTWVSMVTDMKRDFA